ncbi:hypothetical protein ES705_25812 [subsurface metagenome]
MKNFTLIACALLVSYSAIFGQLDGKYLPPENKLLLIIGQDLGAIGGFDSPNNNGYYENVEVIPGGVTSYTSISNLGGLYTLDNWGSGDVCGSCILNNTIYDNSIIAIGLWMVDILDEIIAGNYDENITQLGEWIELANRPVYLRIGYEFNQFYSDVPFSTYVQAYKHIVDVLHSNLVLNYATVWQSNGYGTKNELLQWYPGNEYVDWLGYSHFDGTGTGIIEIAREKNKPVLICEATPRGHDLETEDGETVWNNWFQPLFNHIGSNSDVIKGLAYINVDWDSQPMWSGQGWGDSRVEVNAYILDKWLSEITENKWLNGSPDLFTQLGYVPPSSVDQMEVNPQFELYYYNDEIHFYPENLFQSYGPVDLTIIDAAGRELIREKKDFASNSWPIKLEPGYYIVVLRFHDQWLSTPFFVNPF